MGKAIFVVALVAMGMAGLYLKIEYSGWVLAVGLICAVS